MENNTEFSEFMAAFNDDYQVEETAEETGAENGNEPAETSETQSEQPTEEAEQPAEAKADTEEQPAKQSAEDVFTLKVNKEEKTYTRQEVINLAQKGADYDRVKEQLAESRKELTEVSDLAKEAGQDVPTFLKELRRTIWKSKGLSEDAIEERELRMKAEQENAQLKAKTAEAEAASATDRVKQDLEAFRKEYPDVALTEELLKALSKDMLNGGSLLTAYRKKEATEKDARIAELEKALEAERKNKENRATSPGSQKDSGSKRAKTEFDEFMDAFR